MQNKLHVQQFTINSSNVNITGSGDIVVSPGAPSTCSAGCKKARSRGNSSSSSSTKKVKMAEATPRSKASSIQKTETPPCGVIQCFVKGEPSLLPRPKFNRRQNEGMPKASGKYIPLSSTPQRKLFSSAVSAGAVLTAYLCEFCRIKGVRVKEYATVTKQFSQYAVDEFFNHYRERDTTVFDEAVWQDLDTFYLGHENRTNVKTCEGKFPFCTN